MPLGVWLSGGIDSSTVLHYAATASSRRLKTFSISFRGRSFDETAYIRAAATQYGTDHEEFDVNPEAGLADAIEEFAYYFDEPNADAGALPVWFLSKHDPAERDRGAERRRRRRTVRRISDLSRRPLARWMRRLPAARSALALRRPRGAGRFPTTRSASNTC